MDQGAPTNAGPGIVRPGALLASAQLALLREAVAAIPDVDAVSDLYETAPVGGPEQGSFLNLV